MFAYLNDLKLLHVDMNQAANWLMSQNSNEEAIFRSIDFDAID
jgi:hypothetical protein